MREENTHKKRRALVWKNKSDAADWMQWSNFGISTSHICYAMAKLLGKSYGSTP
jgi:hypothetical protein